MTFRPGMLVEVIAASPFLAHLIGERFILRERGPQCRCCRAHTWHTPFYGPFGTQIIAEEHCIRPVIDDGKQKKDWSDSDNVWSPFVAPAVIRRNRTTPA